MPSKPITIYLNADQSKKTVFLLPVPSNSSEARSRIIKAARDKLRAKNITNVYLPGGILLADSEDTTFPATADAVYVSKGEPFVGSTSDGSLSTWTPGSVRILAEKSFIDDKAIAQLNAVAALQGVHVACGMPDLHPGDRFPIGCAIAAEGIYPVLIGSDIGCGIALYELQLSKSSRLAAQPAKLASMLRGLDEPWEGSPAEWLARYELENKPEFESALGSVGLGNHFAEICAVEKIADESEAERLGIDEDCLYLLVHTGSRGLGSSILGEARKVEANPYLLTQGASFTPYLESHNYAVRWAIANRDLVAHRIAACLHRRSDLSSYLRQTESVDESADAELGSKLKKIVDVTHNSVTQTNLRKDDGEEQMLWIHRKGAAPANYDVAPCPGSRGDFSWLILPQGDGHENAFSLPHGAGRRHPRQMLHTMSRKVKSSLHTTALGSEVICTDPDLLIEEQPEAYKDIQCVIDDVEEKGIGRGIVKLRPLVTYKVREAGERRK